MYGAVGRSATTRIALRPNKGMLANTPNLQHSSAAGGLNVALLGHEMSHFQRTHESWFREVQSGGRCMGVGGKQLRVVLCGYLGLSPTSPGIEVPNSPVRTRTRQREWMEVGRTRWPKCGQAPSRCGGVGRHHDCTAQFVGDRLFWTAGSRSATLGSVTNLSCRIRR